MGEGGGRGLRLQIRKILKIRLSISSLCWLVVPAAPEPHRLDGQRVVCFPASNLCFIPNHRGPVSYTEDRNFENSCNGNIDDSGFWQETGRTLQRGVRGLLNERATCKAVGRDPGKHADLSDSRKPLSSTGLTELFCRRWPPDRCCGPRSRPLVRSLRSVGSERVHVRDFVRKHFRGRWELEWERQGREEEGAGAGVSRASPADPQNFGGQVGSQEVRLPLRLHWPIAAGTGAGEGWNPGFGPCECSAWDLVLTPGL